MSEHPRKKFSEKVKDLAAERSVPIPVIESQLGKLQKRVGTKKPIDLTGTKIDAIKSRLSEHAHGTEAAERLTHQEVLNGKVARYLQDLGTSISNSNELDALKEFFGTPQAESLSEEDKTEVDTYLLGKEAYEKRTERLRKTGKEGITDVERLRTLKAFIKASDREGYRAPHPTEQWKDKVGPMQRLQEKALEGLEASAYMPVHELAQVIARKASDEFLLESPFGSSEKSLAELLNLKEIKENLEKLPADMEPAEKSQLLQNTVNELSKKIYELIPYHSGRGTLSAIKDGGLANCVGYATVGALALREIGIPITFIFSTRHAFVGYTLPNNQFYVNHFQGTRSKKVVEDTIGDSTRPEDLVAFMQDESQKAMAVPLAIGTDFNVWTDNTKHPETLYLYKDMEPALLEWARHRGASDQTELSFGRISGGKPAIESALSPDTRGNLVKAIERNPNDPHLYYSLIEKYERDESYNVLHKWGGFLENTRKSNDLKKYTTGAKISRWFRSLFKR